MKPEDKTVWTTTTDGDDVVRFVLRRKEWHALITGLAVNMTRNQESWDAIQVLQHAQLDVDASAMVRALTQIAKYAQICKPNGHDMELIRATAERGLKEGAPEAKADESATTTTR